MKNEIEKYLNPGLFYLEVLRDKDIQDKKDKHPEQNVFNHSLQVFELLVERTSDFDLLLAGLFHDIGKTFDTLQHDKIGYEILKNYYPEKPLWLIKNHIRIIYYLNGEMKKNKKIDFENHPYFNLLRILRECDFEGRKENYTIEYNKNKIINIFGKLILNRFSKKYIKG